MPEPVSAGLQLLVEVLEIVAASALVVGFLYATVRWFHQARRMDRIEVVERYRQTLGRSILIGLEVLVAATVIKTVAFELTLEGLGKLAAIMTIRATLSWSTVLEMTGRWPWQGLPAEEKDEGDAH